MKIATPGNGHLDLSLLVLFSILEGLLNIKLKYVKLPVREGDQRVLVAEIANAKRVLDWQLIVSAPDGVARTVDFVRVTR